MQIMFYSLSVRTKIELHVHICPFINKLNEIVTAYIYIMVNKSTKMLLPTEHQSNKAQRKRLTCSMFDEMEDISMRQVMKQITGGKIKIYIYHTGCNKFTVRCLNVYIWDQIKGISTILFYGNVLFINILDD